ncbi:hypothetical protein EDD41_2718 [Luteococcus japonicus]|uniref:Uncharacterized protein n=1 Tax=Luteococcus japonicus TaxID=33984 RepID=A0A3N1ZX80_9ACTN|nr:hypothetical protein EDD41_2718 [Luteococcus japonicus]
MDGFDLLLVADALRESLTERGFTHARVAGLVASGGTLPVGLTLFQWLGWRARTSQLCLVPPGDSNCAGDTPAPERFGPGKVQREPKHRSSSGDVCHRANHQYNEGGEGRSRGP